MGDMDMGKNKEENKSKNYKSAVFLHQGCTSSRRQVVRATKYFTVTPSICGFQYGTRFRITFLAPRILSCRLDFSKMCASSV
jgi:hypothetical protein